LAGKGFSALRNKKQETMRGHKLRNELEKNRDPNCVLNHQHLESALGKKSIKSGQNKRYKKRKKKEKGLPHSRGSANRKRGGKMHCKEGKLLSTKKKK